MYRGPGIYEHHKGKKYFVLGLAQHSETNAELVVYRPLYETDWAHMVVRPRVNFDAKVGAGASMRSRFEQVQV